MKNDRGCGYYTYDYYFIFVRNFNHIRKLENMWCLLQIGIDTIDAYVIFHLVEKNFMIRLRLRHIAILINLENLEVFTKPFNTNYSNNKQGKKKKLEFRALKHQ